MTITQLIDEDFVNYKVPSMYIGFPKCDFKCDKECGMQVCQNGVLAKSPHIDVDDKDIIERYMNNPITSAVIIAGLEPFDTFDQLLWFIARFRVFSNDDIVIYTGYNRREVYKEVERLKFYTGIVVKFGRYIPNQEQHYDKCLGVKLASDNQYAIRIS